MLRWRNNAQIASQTGFASMNAELGLAPSFAWSWGTGVVPSGYVPASEAWTLGLKKGRVVWANDDLTPPPGSNAAHGMPEQPIEIVIAKAGRFWRFDVHGMACLRKLAGTVPWKPGDAWVQPSGDYSPLASQGATDQLVSSGSWTTSQTEAITDTVSTATDLLSAFSDAVSPGSAATQPAFTFTGTVTNLTRAPKPPTLTRCG
ncbi:MAG TPA: hypothetical protein VHX88_22315 [Solirubrobacteraceae bacterium]|jgi:hypothetical protein|nr:hypothetical protein [Solirubrobacteraceae bacterium]